MKLVLRVLLALIGLEFGLSASAGGTVVYDYTATVQNVADYSGQNYVPSSIQPGSTIVGSFSYNPAGNTGPGFFRDLFMNSTATIDGTYTYRLSGATPSTEVDIYSGTFGMYQRGPDSHPAFSSAIPFSHFEFFGLNTSTSDVANPQLVLTGNSTVGISDQQSPGKGYYYIGAQITSLTLASPEPASLSLLVLGAAAAFWARRRRAG